MVTKFFPFQEPPCNPKACSKDMDEKNVCGSDGLTYPNRCHLEKVRCVNKNLTLTKRGPCRQQKACRDWEVYRHSNPDYKFQANCRPDGSYAAAQCHPDTGFCWCVTPQVRHTDGSSQDYLSRPVHGSFINFFVAEQRKTNNGGGVNYWRSLCRTMSGLCGEVRPRGGY